MLPKDGFSPSSGYLTWIDYSRRLKQEHGVSEEDMNLFTQKYWGFIISRCIKKNLDDEQTTAFIGLFFQNFFIKKRLQFDKTKGSFHSWFATVIDRDINSFMRKVKSLEKKNGKVTFVDIENLNLDDELVFDENKETDIEEDELVKRYGAMLVWEEVFENAIPEQKLCFSYFLKGYTPAQIAQETLIESTKVSDHIRNFKNKLRNNFKKYYAKVDFENLNLAELKEHSQWARTAIDNAIAKYQTMENCHEDKSKDK